MTKWLRGKGQPRWYGEAAAKSVCWEEHHPKTNGLQSKATKPGTSGSWEKAPGRAKRWDGLQVEVAWLSPEGNGKTIQWNQGTGEAGRVKLLGLVI